MDSGSAGRDVDPSGEEETSAHEVNALRTRLREQETLYELLVQQQQDIVCRFLPNTTITFASDAYCRHTGRERADLIGRPFLERLACDHRERLLELIDPDRIAVVRHSAELVHHRAGRRVDEIAADR